jgi:hypothetical protein
MTGILPDDRTTDKRPASFLESIPDDIGYNDLEACRYRRLVMLERLRLNSYLTPLSKRASVQVRALYIQLLKCVF